ncbi:hypothetical protein AMTR_s00112p00091750 [Amborella trichopoda]|uniref:Uncharacterized protein n=2 Tax=Amborella trichopoda TaxID=13333 RepID=W1NZI2_AMBTC|nr:hypothetical protein AMTR_s00112p00091750 [Amborella trichopoda]
MSFLAGRLASTEAACFLQESKQAVGRLAEKLPQSRNCGPNSIEEFEAKADVLPEILRHSIPLTAVRPPSESSLSFASKWVLPHSSDSLSNGTNYAELINPHRAYVSLPQVTFGPRRWNLPNDEHSFSASTANEVRRDKIPRIDN